MSRCYGNGSKFENEEDGTDVTYERVIKILNMIDEDDEISVQLLSNSDGSLSLDASNSYVSILLYMEIDGKEIRCESNNKEMIKNLVRNIIM